MWNVTRPSNEEDKAKGRLATGGAPLPNPEEVNEFHRYDDSDNSPESHHHTLGIDPNQSSPGDHNHDGRNSKTLSATSHTHADYLTTTGKAADSESLDGIDSLGFMRNVELSTSNIGSRTTRNIDGQSLNRYLSSGWYDGSNAVGAPDGNWYLIHVISHSNSVSWQRQIAHSMTSEQSLQTIYSRRCNGGDPTVASNWSAWEVTSSQDMANGSTSAKSFTARFTSFTIHSHAEFLVGQSGSCDMNVAGAFPGGTYTMVGGNNPAGPRTVISSGSRRFTCNVGSAITLTPTNILGTINTIQWHVISGTTTHA